MADSYENLPDDLPRPEDDGTADHLPGTRLPSLSLRASDGSELDLAELGTGTTILYVYPMTGRPGVDLPEGWDAIPGARGCTPEACGFRDHHAELVEAGASRVFGVSTQTPEYQRELADRLGLPFPMLSDADLELAHRLRLPTFEVPDAGPPTLLKRMTLVVTNGRIEHVFYPVFPPDAHAAEVLGWLRAHPRSAATAP